MSDANRHSGEKWFIEANCIAVFKDKQICVDSFEQPPSLANETPLLVTKEEALEGEILFEDRERKEYEG
jgi:hypothetical protein